MELNYETVKLYLENMFSEYTAPPHSFTLCDIFNNNSVIITDHTELMKKYFTSAEQASDRNYIMQVAKKEPAILAVADELIKNDGELFLELFRKKHTVAAYIGQKLRNDADFLLSMDKIDPICWKYFTKKHLVPATFEQKLYQWCLYQLSIYEYETVEDSGTRAKIKLKDKFSLGSSLQLGLIAALGKINIFSEKQDIISFISKSDCYILDPYYEFHVRNPEVAKLLVAYNYLLLYELDERLEWIKNYEIVYCLWENIKNLTSVWDIAFDGIKNFSDNMELAKLVLEQRQYGWAIKHFSKKIRGDKEFILSLLKRGILRTQALFYLSDTLKHDEDIICAIKRNSSLYADWQRYEKYYKNRKARS